MPLESVGTLPLWIGFTIFVLAMLVLDLAVFHRRPHEVSIREAFVWSVVWITLSIVFGVGVYHWFGTETAIEFYTGWLLEKSLSVDNLFVFLVIFSYFGVAVDKQHRVLFWGILGALVLRGVFIFAGAALVQRFHWVLYIFGAFLIYTGAKLFKQQEEVDPEKNPVLKLFRRFVPMVNEFHDARFVIVKDGRRYATPLLAVLCVIEASDVIFAVDSVPAIFGVTTDPFIVYTSNIFAILGLRAMYFLLSGMMRKFHYLHIGLALVLIFIGVKLLIESVYAIPTFVSLLVVALVIGVAVMASLALPTRGERGERES